MLQGCLAYILNGVFIRMYCVKSVCVCVFASKPLFYHEERKSSENFLMLIFARKKKIPLEKITSAAISDDKMLLLTGIIGKHVKFVTFFVYMNDEL